MKPTNPSREIQEFANGSAEVQPLDLRHNGGTVEKSAFPPFAFSMPQVRKPAVSPSDCTKAGGECLLDNSTNNRNGDSLQERTKRKRRAVALGSRIAVFDRRRGERMRRCGLRFWQGETKCEHRHKGEKGSSFLCNDRLCPFCSRVRSALLVRRLSEPLREIQRAEGLTASFVTLTLRNVEVLPAFGAVVQARRRLLRSKFWREYGLWGSIGSVEVKLGAGSGLWHVHLHLVVLTRRALPLLPDGNWAVEVNQALSEAWEKASKGAGFIVRGKAFDGDYREILKYISKGVEEMGNERLREFANWSKGRRFLFTTGGLYGNRELREAVQQAEDCGLQGFSPCPECGCREFEIRELEWSGDLDNYVVRRVFDYVVTDDKGGGSG